MYICSTKNLHTTNQFCTYLVHPWGNLEVKTRKKNAIYRFFFQNQRLSKCFFLLSIDREFTYNQSVLHISSPSMGKSGSKNKKKKCDLQVFLPKPETIKMFLFTFNAFFEVVSENFKARVLRLLKLQIKELWHAGFLQDLLITTTIFQNFEARLLKVL